MLAPIAKILKLTIAEGSAFTGKAESREGAALSLYWGHFYKFQGQDSHVRTVALPRLSQPVPLLEGKAIFEDFIINSTADLPKAPI